MNIAMINLTLPLEKKTREEIFFEEVEKYTISKINV